MPLFKIETWAAEHENEQPKSTSAMSKSPIKLSKNKVSVHLMEFNRKRKSSLFNTKVSKPVRHTSPSPDYLQNYPT